MTILFTGGSGLLGSEFKLIRPEYMYPDSKVLDVSSARSVKEYFKNNQVDMVIHAAAFTSPPKIDQYPDRAISTNIIGTSLLVRECQSRGIRLVYISTDYVFSGEKGNYSEGDELLPVNKYAWSKLGGECAVRLYDHSLIIRTTFSPNEFPYEKAFTDQWTSRISVKEAAARIAVASESAVNGVLHIGDPGKTVFEFAKSLETRKEIGMLSINDVGFKAPRDTSLDCRKYELILKESGKS